MNGGIIRVLLKDCLPELVSQKHISHFRTNLHSHIDKVMFFYREQYKAKRAGKGASVKGKENARMETNGSEVEQPRVARPLYSDEQIPEAKFATPGHSSASEQVQPPKKAIRRTMQ
jgi:ribosomal protein L19E